ncbi:MAG: hypothetical protein KBD83_01575 [Gammaproteobacteria bacterium]|nr:hypothetical protein [Gammaproteobacteria bacterium]
MKQSSKIALSLGIVTSLLTISQISSAEAATSSATSYSWADSSGGQTIIFNDSTDRACAKATPKKVVFAYTKDSNGKDMKLVKSRVFKEITQESRKAGNGYDFTYTDTLTPRNTKDHPIVLLKGAVKAEGENKMTNQGSWQLTTQSGTPCSGQFEIRPAKLSQ